MSFVFKTSISPMHVPQGVSKENEFSPCSFRGAKFPNRLQLGATMIAFSSSLSPSFQRCLATLP